MDLIDSSVEQAGRSGYAPGDAEYAARTILQSRVLSDKGQQALGEALGKRDESGGVDKLNLAQVAYKLSFSEGPEFQRAWQEVLEDLVEHGGPK